MELNIELKQMIIESLELEEISPEDIIDGEPLFGEGLGLDSIDALELGMALKRKYNITLSSNKEDNKKYFYRIFHIEYSVFISFNQYKTFEKK